jgi:hypothetical protein
MAELIQAGGNTLCSEIHELITSVWDKEKLPQEWKEFIIVPIYKRGDNWLVTTEEYHCYQLIQNFIQYSYFKVTSLHK